jgi:hypothetical protein
VGGSAVKTPVDFCKALTEVQSKGRHRIGAGQVKRSNAIYRYSCRLTGRWDVADSPRAGADSKVCNPFRTGGIIVLIRILPHRSEIVLGVLEVILRRDPVPGQGFGAGQGQIALIVPLSILSVPSLKAG